MPRRLRELLLNLKIAESYEEVVQAVLATQTDANSHRLMEVAWQGRESMPLSYWDVKEENYIQNMRFYTDYDVEALARQTLERQTQVGASALVGALLTMRKAVN